VGEVWGEGSPRLPPSFRILDFLRIRQGGVNDAKREPGSVESIRSAFVEIQRHLFRQA